LGVTGSAAKSSSVLGARNLAGNDLGQGEDAAKRACSCYRPAGGCGARREGPNPPPSLDQRRQIEWQGRQAGHRVGPPALTVLRISAAAADPAGLTATAGPDARPEARAANPRSELGIYQENTDLCYAHVRCEHL